VVTCPAVTQPLAVSALPAPSTHRASVMNVLHAAAAAAASDDVSFTSTAINHRCMSHFNTLSLQCTNDMKRKAQTN